MLFSIAFPRSATMKDMRGYEVDLAAYMRIQPTLKSLNYPNTPVGQ
jgi:hypothetical protein